ncbi:MAG: hypothetical protein OES46_20945, partial [Gammaproteobacteria bacterium]|nr:hypothetical protein [Gammaproteobacteria bacterium]
MPLGSAPNGPWPANRPSLAASAHTLTGKAVKITDGDTRYVLNANYQDSKNASQSSRNHPSPPQA